ncbi:chromate resistance protein ChrB domain-containing protein [Hymenobacter sp. BT491]|uniref:chromate resistance protein ChrB domain-containing protein n=1 Tax=Hymenobacter sp. BT491 TaxID=2766779 RepID=UPI00292A4111|nr:chromate resistance protein ChrB domain-containing protein [Hymenobacter sp. BT491]
MTRERPKIDRLACPWLILRFIDPAAQILYVPAAEVLPTAAQTGAIPFDVPEAEFTHYGTDCAFDYFLRKYQLTDPALHALASIVRGADTDNHALAQQAAGLWAISDGEDWAKVAAEPIALCGCGGQLRRHLLAECAVSAAHHRSRRDCPTGPRVFLDVRCDTPLIERTQHNLPLKAVLSIITAAVVGVILNLAVYLGQAVLFPSGLLRLGALHWPSLLWILLSLVALCRRR